jgi:hypothetical protein
LRRIPSKAEGKRLLRALAGRGGWPAVVERAMKGVYFLAVYDHQEQGDRQYFKTTRGRYVDRSYVSPLPATRLRGQRLKGTGELPLAFVYTEPQRCLDPDDVDEGREATPADDGDETLQKYARFRFTRIVEQEEAAYMVADDNCLVPEEAVRVARPIAPPRGVPPGEKWIHIDLSEQTLVAYEGERPVFATLVSTGREGHQTPTGLYRITAKHAVTTMRGEDPVEGWYEVEEVPWTMFYRPLYAVHGAYWHDGFGDVRSHGCTNLAPADARWLFYWSAPSIPTTWHGHNGRGSWVYFTN